VTLLVAAGSLIGGSWRQRLSLLTLTRDAATRWDSAHLFFVRVSSFTSRGGKKGVFIFPFLALLVGYLSRTCAWRMDPPNGGPALGAQLLAHGPPFLAHGCLFRRLLAHGPK